MRTLTTTEQKALASGHYKPIVRVYVEDADGSFVALHDLRGYDWVDTVDITSDIDTPVEQLTLTLFRDVYQMGLSPLNEDSILNIDGVGSYAPLLDAGRKLYIETPLAPLDTPDGFSYVGENANRYRVFDGVIDEIDWSQPRVEVVARDLGGDLQLAFIETEQEYGADDGSVLAESVIQGLLDNNGYSGVILALPDGASNLAIRLYTQQHQHLMSAMQDVNLQRGWLLRYKFDNTSLTYKLTFYDPQRNKTIPDVTIGPDQYIDVRRLNINRIPVRNVVRVTYTDASDDRHTVTAEDATSIARYGRLFMGLTEDASSQINTNTAAVAMAEAIRDDRKDPKAEQEIEMHYRYDLELTDLVRWQANGVHYTTDQDLAIVSIRHSLSGSSHRTHVTVRGTPAGAYTQWMLREERDGVGDPVRLKAPPIPMNVSASGIRGGVAVSFDTPKWRDRWDRTEVHISETPSFTPSALTLADSGRKTAFEITEGLTAEATYYIRLINVDAQKTRSDPSIEVSVVSGELIPDESITDNKIAGYDWIPPQVVMLAAKVDTDANVVLRWNRITDAAYYEVEVNSADTYTTASTAYTLTGLYVDSTIAVRVRAVSRFGVAGAWSTVQNTSVPELLSSTVAATYTAQTEFETLTDAMFFDDVTGEFSGENLTPNTVKTGALAVGSNTRNFQLRGIEFEPNVDNTKGRISATAGVLIMIRPPGESGTTAWSISAYAANTLAADTQYYVYARCSKTAATGNLQFETATKPYEDATYWYFLLGVYDTNPTPAILALSYGFTYISGNVITTGTVNAAVVNIESGEIYLNSDGLYSGPSYGHVDSSFGISNSTGDAYFNGTLAAGIVTYEKLNVAYAVVDTVGTFGHGTVTIEHEAQNQNEYNLIKWVDALDGDEHSILIEHQTFEILSGFYDVALSSNDETFYVAGYSSWGAGFSRSLTSATVLWGHIALFPNSAWFKVKKLTGTNTDLWIKYRRHSIS